MAKIDLPDLHTKKEVDNARTKGDLLLLGVIGWIPTLAVIGVGGFVVYKLFSGPKKDG